MEELSGHCPRLEGDGDGPVAVLVGKVGGAAEPAFGGGFVGHFSPDTYVDS